MQGWRVASQYGPNERVERASAGHIEKQPNIRAWRLILSIFTQREIDRSVYRIYTQKHLHLHIQGLSTLKKYFPIKFIYKNLMKKQRGKKWRGRYHFYLVVISPHHSRAISLQGNSNSDIPPCTVHTWYHPVHMISPSDIQLGILTRRKHGFSECRGWCVSC